MFPRREAELDAADTFVPLVLGALSLLRRFDRVLEMVPAATDGGEEEKGPVGKEALSTIHLILGIIVLRDRLYSHLEAASLPHGEATAKSPAPDTTPTDQPRRSLRR